MSRPARPAPSAAATEETVFAVQPGTSKGTGLINYVLVASLAPAGLFHEFVGYGHGRLADATTRVPWQSPYPRTLPRTLDLALRTDGRAPSRVSVGGRIVFSSRTLRMNIQPPFQAYLEVQSPGVPYMSRFQDFSITSGGAVSMTGARPGARVTLTDAGVADSVQAGADDLPPLLLPPLR